MGYIRCAVRECPTRVNGGKMFKKFPTDQKLATLWLQNLPKNFQLKKHSAVCEDHFDCEAFEKVRVDGKRKFKWNAVPRPPVPSPRPSRRALGDVTNIKATSNAGPTRHSGEWQQRDGSTLQGSTLSCRVDAAEALLMLSGTATTEDKENCGGMSVVTPDESGLGHVFHSTLYDASDVGQHSEIMDIDEHEHNPQGLDLRSDQQDSVSSQGYFLDDTSGVLMPISLAEVESLRDSETDSIDGSQQKEMQFFATYQNDGTVVLDELSGRFRHAILPDVPDQESNYNEINSEMTFHHMMEMVQNQEAEITRLRQVIQDYESTTTELKSNLEFLGAFSDNFTRKYDAMRKRKERLQQENMNFTSAVNRELHSPWLRQSQLQRIWRTSNRGLKWEAEDIRDGLILKMRCGTSGYSAFVKQIPLLPSVRTLKESVQFIRFDSGLLEEVFDLLKMMVRGMKDYERDCQVILDEMAIEEGERYCNSLKKWVGISTLPTHEGRATKALVIMLAGIQVRWKISVAVYFTNKRSLQAKRNQKENPTGKAYCDIINEVISRSENLGLLVCGITSDMGAENLAFWKELGVTGGRNQEVVSSFPNPVRKDAEVCVMPDPVHLMKATKTMMESNVTLYLPEDVVEAEGLPSPIVDYRHVDDLLEFEGSSELKVAFRLRENNVHCTKQFKKMNVGTTKAVLCHRTGVGLKMMAQTKHEPIYETTGWFFILINTLFSLLTSRHGGMALSKLNNSSLEKAINLIKLVDHIFHFMKVGDKGEWKPVQRGMRVLCSSVLKLADYFLEKRGYRYVMLGRFCSDCLENLFSCIRLSQPIPHAVAFLQCLKVMTLAQFSEAVRGSSYEYDECVSVDFWEDIRSKAKERTMTRFYESLEELFSNAIRRIEEEDYCMIDAWEKSVVYDMAGSVVCAILSSNMVVCDTCINATKWKGTEPHPASTLTEMKEFTLLRSDQREGPLQIFVSNEVFMAVLKAEISFRLFREKTINFEHADVKQYFVENLLYVWEGSNIPNCHHLGRKMLNVYFDARLKEFGKIRSDSMKKAKSAHSVQMSSKTVAMHGVAEQILAASKKTNQCDQA